MNQNAFVDHVPGLVPGAHRWFAVATMVGAVGLLVACQGDATPSSQGTQPNTGGVAGAAAAAGAPGAAGAGGSAAGVAGDAAGSAGSAAGAASGGAAAGGTLGGGASAGGGVSGGGTASLGGQTTGGTAGAGGAAGTNAGGTAGAGMGGGAGAGGAANLPLCKTTPQTLKDAGACSGRLIGTALAASHLGESQYQTTAKEFNFATPENEMKWGSIEPSQGSFSYGSADQIVNFAKTNGMKVKGHTLVWHNQLPGWVSSLGTADQVRSAMVNHITQVMGHYKGNSTVVAWDVVNEAWENDGSKLRDSPFSSKLGTGFIDEAFKAARAADPNVKLYYNDFRADGMNAKSNSIYNMVKGMVERGVPIDGVGLQMHTGTPNPPSPPAEVLQNLQRITALGIEVLISEMDSHVCDGLTSAQQKQYYHDIVAACVSVPKCTAITFWGASDKYSWLNSFNETNCGGKDPSGCLWDANWMKKPAYSGVMDALQGK